ncbi:Pex15p NDAI_0A08540 [Naumovozyma dairenensis CBS 421]|uniref:Uncharacterized protein n=1 Tax=Naumovozyma dairenensis (strain ATCC 10597 / BCRC 20456 / CBS 421 / NBRC 0211 / NRRL Y-12639) TaxID=1071378 RepID=G0W5B9_NAUDC|nr:hypothetical protein NDAI_0A08540 [Naumovozyma dairenensis CBS 421]CCD23007.1 hypothetical protein NDAI_0A08540 [Naumovozyma dairenensis CBS 421]
MVTESISCISESNSLDSHQNANSDEPSGSTGISLQNLLDDTMFDEYNTNDDDDLKSDVDEAYQECLNLFLKGKIKSCLEKMLELDLLQVQLLKSNKDIFVLFLLACKTNNDGPRILGINIQKIAEIIFDGVFMSTNNLLFQFDNTEEYIRFLNIYFHCCVEQVELEGKDKGKSIFNLKNSLEHAIDNTLLLPRVDDTQVTEGIQELVHTLLFDIEIKSMKKQRTPTLYLELSNRIPELSNLLNESFVSGISREKIILDLLEKKHVDNELKRKKIKNNNRSHQKRHGNYTSLPPSPSKMSPKENLTIAESTSSKNTDQEPTDKETVTDMTNYKQYFMDHLWNQMISLEFLHKKPTILLATLTFLLILKKIKLFKYIFKNIPNLIKKLLPYIVDVLNLLSSI